MHRVRAHTGEARSREVRLSTLLRELVTPLSGFPLLRALVTPLSGFPLLRAPVTPSRHDMDAHERTTGDFAPQPFIPRGLFQSAEK